MHASKGRSDESRATAGIGITISYRRGLVNHCKGLIQYHSGAQYRYRELRA